jgi:hypothetical protein
MDLIPGYDFYGEYRGHLVEHLSIVHRHLSDRPRVFLAGDSSLDSKFYQTESKEPPINGYEQILTPTHCRRDVCYWLNKELGPEYAVINCAVEESTLRERESTLLPQDEFIRDNISARDILVVSVGGNDVALKPTIRTAWNAAKATLLNSASYILAHPDKAWGMPHFRRLFCDETQVYVEKLVAKQKPRAICACMIYFPDEDSAAPSWSSTTLRLLAYNSHPERLQAFIMAAYECGTKNISVSGTTVVPCALFEVMDGKKSELYVARVEPSEEGGAAISRLLATRIWSAVLTPQ